MEIEIGKPGGILNGVWHGRSYRMSSRVGWTLDEDGYERFLETGGLTEERIDSLLRQFATIDPGSYHRFRLPW